MGTVFFATTHVDGKSALRVMIQTVADYNGTVYGFETVIKNLLTDTTFTVREHGSDYRSAYHFAYQLSGVMECDFQDLQAYGYLLKK